MQRRLGWLKFAISLILIGWLLREYAGADLTAAISKASIPVLIAVLVVNFSASMLIPALVHKRALGGRSEPTYAQLLRVNLVVKFYAMILPKGMSLGIRWARYRTPLGGRSAAGLVVVELITQVLGAAAIALAGIVIEWAMLGDRALPLTLIGILLLAGAGSVAYTLLEHPTSGPMSRLSAWVQEQIGLSRRAEKPEDLGKQMIPVVALTLMGQLLIVMAAWFVAVDLELGLSLAAVAWMRSVISLIALLPFTVAGLGIREAGYVAFAGLYGVSGENALAFALVLLAIQLAIALVGATIELREAFRKDETTTSDSGVNGVIASESGSDPV